MQSLAHTSQSTFVDDSIRSIRVAIAAVAHRASSDGRPITIVIVNATSPADSHRIILADRPRSHSYACLSRYSSTTQPDRSEPQSSQSPSRTRRRLIDRTHGRDITRRSISSSSSLIDRAVTGTRTHVSLDTITVDRFESPLSQPSSRRQRRSARSHTRSRHRSSVDFVITVADRPCSHSYSRLS